LKENIHFLFQFHIQSLRRGKKKKKLPTRSYKHSDDRVIVT